MFTTPILAIVAATSAHAPQVQPPLRETIGGKKPVLLLALRVSGVLIGSMAETTVRMMFFNPNSWKTPVSPAAGPTDRLQRHHIAEINASIKGVWVGNEEIKS